MRNIIIAYSTVIFLFILLYAVFVPLDTGEESFIRVVAKIVDDFVFGIIVFTVFISQILAKYKPSIASVRSSKDYVTYSFMRTLLYATLFLIAIPILAFIFELIMLTVVSGLRPEVVTFCSQLVIFVVTLPLLFLLGRWIGFSSSSHWPLSISSIILAIVIAQSLESILHFYTHSLSEQYASLAEITLKKLSRSVDDLVIMLLGFGLGQGERKQI